MHPKFDAAALKCLEAVKLIQSVKDPKFAELRDKEARTLAQVVTRLIEHTLERTDKKV